MRTKRTIFSMVVFLSVFWLSIVLEIESPTSSVRKNLSAAENSVATTGSLVSENTSSRIMSYSYDGGVTASRDNRLYDNQTYKDDGSEVDAVVADTATETKGSSVSRTDNEEISTSTSATADIASDEGTINGMAVEATGNLVGTEPGAETSPEASAETADVVIAEAAAVKEAPSEYANIGISVANNFVNIREKADTESEVLGKLYKDSAAEILDTIDDWYYVESGSVKGYVKAEYIKTGIPDDELIDRFGVLRISVGVDGLNVREEASTESDKLTVVYQSERYPVVELQEEWVKVDITDDRVIGYVKREMIELIVDFKKAVSKEEEAELLRLQAEERAKQETAVKYRDEVDYTEDELKLLACLVHSEAGNQSYEGRLAVANIVLNRVKSSKFPDTIKEVIYSPGQFTVASSGSLAKQLANYDSYSSSSQKLSIKAARAALEGANNIGGRLYFHSYKAALRKGYETKEYAVKVEDQLFW